MGSIVIAVGGNAISDPNSMGSMRSQSSRIRKVAKEIAKLYLKGNRIVLTHGNGPQVGRELERNEIAAKKIPEFPLYYLTAETESVMGSAMETALRAELSGTKKENNICTIVSHVLTEKSDKSFSKPSKPIGPFMTKSELKEELLRGKFAYIEKKGKYRRIVPSPRPVKVLEAEIISDLSKNRLVICGGGGGIPLVKKGKEYAGIAAVLDKDLTTALLATEIGAEKMIILTDSEYLYANFERKEGAISEIKLKPLKKLVERLEEGTIKPKVLACINFLECGGKEAYIGNVYNLAEILKGESGTRMTR